MANTRSSKKDLRRIAKKRVTNLNAKSALKTYVKKVRTALATGDAATTESSLKAAVSALDKAQQRGIIHKNQAARRKSRIARAANHLSAPSQTKTATPKKAATKGKGTPSKAKAAKPAAKKSAAPKEAKSE